MYLNFLRFLPNFTKNSIFSVASLVQRDLDQVDLDNTRTYS